MPLPNRVTPFGELVSDPARGLFMGNRGGRIHDDDRNLRRRWASRRWICCRLAFRDRRREVWGMGYTELFFLDEPTALSAGHRPCFECRRGDARRFAVAFAAAHGLAAPPSADVMDRILHRQRTDAGRAGRRPMDDLPDGAFVLPMWATQPAQAWVVRGDRLLRWTAAGYRDWRPRARGVCVEVLTPPAMLGALSAGYRPLWHPSAVVAPAEPWTA